MKFLVIYDSQYGNTQQVARAIAERLAAAGSGYAIKVDDVQAGDLAGVTTLVVGSPTQKFAATPAIKRWLGGLPPASLSGIRAAAFDTRFPQEKIDEIKILAFFVRIFGYAAEPIANRLVKKGAELIAEPEGFYVADTEGPLLERELARAGSWGEDLA